MKKRKQKQKQKQKQEYISETFFDIYGNEVLKMKTQPGNSKIEVKLI